MVEDTISRYILVEYTTSRYMLKDTTFRSKLEDTNRTKQTCPYWLEPQE